MTKIEFRVSTKTKTKAAVIYEGDLVFVNDGVDILSFPANSGGWGKGPLPYGVYDCAVPRALPSSAPSGFMGDKFKWIMGISPKFKTHRFDLAIHPDGGYPGTLGCVGITQDDILCFDALMTHRPTELRVYDHSENT